MLHFYTPWKRQKTRGLINRTSSGLACCIDKQQLSTYSSIVNEVIGTAYLFIFFTKIFCIKNTQALFKYLNTSKKHSKAHKQLSLKHYAQKHNKAHKQLSFRDYAQKYKKKQATFHLNIFICLKKVQKQLSFRYYVQKHKNKQLFFQRLVQDVMSNFRSDISMLKKKMVGTRCNK